MISLRISESVTFFKNLKQRSNTLRAKQLCNDSTGMVCLVVSLPFQLFSYPLLAVATSRQALFLFSAHKTEEGRLSSL